MRTQRTKLFVFSSLTFHSPVRFQRQDAFMISPPFRNFFRTPQHYTHNYTCIIYQFSVLSLTNAGLYLTTQCSEPLRNTKECNVIWSFSVGCSYKWERWYSENTFWKLRSSGTTSCWLVIIYWLFKKLDASFFTVDNEEYTENWFRNLLRNIGN